MQTFLNFIHLLLLSPYTLLFLAVVLEGPIATLVAAFLAAQGVMNVYVVSVVVILGDVGGDCMHYAIGRFGRHQFINRWGKYIGITPARMQRIESHYDTHSGKTVLISKIAHGIGAAFLVGAGLGRMPFRKYLAYSTAGTIPKSILLIFIGYYFGQSIQQLRQYFNIVALGSVTIAIIFIVVYTLVVRFGRKAERGISR